MSAPESDSDFRVAYRNTNTGEVFLFAEASPTLDARPNFTRCDIGDVPEAARVAALRAATEQAAIEAAYVAREHLTAEQAAAVAVAAPVGVPTGAHYTPESSNDATGVLSNPEMQNDFPNQEDMTRVDEGERTAMDERGVLERNDDDKGVQQSVATKLALLAEENTGDQAGATVDAPADPPADGDKPKGRRRPADK